MKESSNSDTIKLFKDEEQNINKIKKIQDVMESE